VGVTLADTRSRRSRLVAAVHWWWALGFRAARKATRSGPGSQKQCIRQRATEERRLSLHVPYPWQTGNGQGRGGQALIRRGSPQRRPFRQDWGKRAACGCGAGEGGAWAGAWTAR
jgi:hypothetical protein